MAPQESNYNGPTLGQLIKHERLRAGIPFRVLSERSGVSKGQLHKLESDRVQKPNAAHLAAIAGPLKVPVSQLYMAAGYDIGELPSTESELTRKLRDLSPSALTSVARLVDQFIASGDRNVTAIPVSLEGDYPNEPEQEQEGGTPHE